ncbi:MAG TPA: restriction endonuclease, partial [Cyanobacteria bacterium UBA11049]|nr:restriction endonuclease [Cyanobacteria bacterium UBA11049]
LRQFEATEANLAKLEKLWNLLQKNVPDGIVFIEANPVYEDACRSYEHILAGLPRIGGWKPTALPCDLDEIAQSRLDAFEVGEVEIQIEVVRQIEKPGRELREYRFQFNQKRRQLIQNIMFQTFNEIDRLLDQLRESFPIDEASIEYGKKIEDPAWQILHDKVKQVDVLLGSSVPRPPRWSDMKRHLYYGQTADLRDIIDADWPSVKAGLTTSLYTSNEPIPVGVSDLAELVASSPSGSVLTKLNWEKLSAEDFERLIFNLVASEQNHENTQWLMRTNAPDRGRDLSVYRIYRDRLSSVIRKRVVIQCKHWLNKSISLSDISAIKEQVKLWEPPRVDVLVMATSGRFTADAVNYAERHNQSDSAMMLELWPESHLETILASSPALVAEFGLR